MGPNNLYFNKPFRAGGLGIVLLNPVGCWFRDVPVYVAIVCPIGGGCSWLLRLFAFAASSWFVFQEVISLVKESGCWRKGMDLWPHQ